METVPTPIVTTTVIRLKYRGKARIVKRVPFIGTTHLPETKNIKLIQFK